MWAVGTFRAVKGNPFILYIFNKKKFELVLDFVRHICISTNFFRD
jgi:hypothetical protein